MNLNVASATWSESLAFREKLSNISFVSGQSELNMTLTLLFSVQLTPFPLSFSPFIKYASVSNYFSEKIILINKIPAFLQAFEVVISMPTNEQGGIWVGFFVTSSKEVG